MFPLSNPTGSLLFHSLAPLLCRLVVIRHEYVLSEGENMIASTEVCSFNEDMELTPYRWSKALWTLGFGFRLEIFTVAASSSDALF